ncbi:formamidase [Aneurinibacillus aneurinilyticus]|nr:formamidase [Aneurinibacillus aneurinilyticus]MED0669645.1 acetamidase/formamidase family protein [Aneurinibacillus aneurinilyticus]MED0709268.1 acetamidase/formamidase family protein [Aneurinibacillus aneurinilyticus]MED0724898.1 acetamidase/formamidase family protein [Aneurinibacillus aneurinilyticus]MED0732487.1 acetamidase/formamidase family protein [Aneurinibacillus aneurinilyticus]MED0744079.1 acetamidase/formamidase family protein [Aneurinibacillus aneurinilyticus]
MPEVLFRVDLNKPMDEQETPGHNRWHPDIPATVSVNPGDIFRIECKDWTDGQISNNDDPSDIRDVNLNRVHVLSGPIWVNGVEPGDLLVVDILDIGAIQGAEWGFNGVFDKQNGGSFLTEHYPEALKSIWDFQGIYTTSRHIPGVKFAGIIHPGLIGTAPSHEMLAKWNKREKKLFDSNPNRVPTLANLPTPDSAVLGTLKEAEFDRVAREGARTVPPRENGGNCDIKNLSKGSRIYFPVFVQGGKLSLGDIHFSQGDGEITFCGGIEMAGWVDLHVDVIKGGMSKYNIINNPIFKPGPVEPHYSDYLVFEGISVDEFTGDNHYLDAHIAYRRACLNAIEYLKTLGYTGEQAYMILGTAPVEGRISGIVDVPNACCTVAIPTAIFDKDILPKLNR